MLSNTHIKIGAVVATSGPVARLGHSFVRAIQLAKEDLDSTRYRYDLLIQEIASPADAETAIKKLIEIDHVNAMIVGLSVSGAIVKPYATAAKIPMFCICSIGSVADELYTFTTMPLAEDEAAEWVREARRRNIQRVALITQDYPSINNHVRALRVEAARAGIEFVYATRFEAAENDFSARIAAAQQTAPDIYFVEGFNPALDLLGAQLRDAGITDLASVVAFSLTEQPELFEGGWYTDSYVGPEFGERLRRRYPDERLATHMVPYAYDSLKMLVQGFESGPDVLDYIRGLTSYNGTAGMITKEAGTGNFRSAPAVWVIENGKPVLVEQASQPVKTSA
jgi:ABC-type branched-subunit amino acid transport system substrate-binding protein